MTSRSREVRHLLELVVAASEMDGALKILQTDKLDAVLRPARLFDSFDILLARQTWVLTLQKGGDTGDEKIMVGPDELQIVIVPRVGDGGSVRDDEHVVEVHAHAEVVDGKGLAEARLGVPEILRRGLVGEAFHRLHHSLLLTVAELIMLCGLTCHDAVVLAEVVEVTVRLIHADTEPLGVRLLLHAELIEIGMEVLVEEGLVRALINGVAMPFEVPCDVCRMALLCDTVLHMRLFGIANLHPSVVSGDLRRCIGVDLWKRHTGGLYIWSLHHSISFTWVSIKSRSSFVKPYLS